MFIWATNIIWVIFCNSHLGFVPVEHLIQAMSNRTNDEVEVCLFVSQQTKKRSGLPYHDNHNGTTTYDYELKAQKRKGEENTEKAQKALEGSRARLVIASSDNQSHRVYPPADDFKIVDNKHLRLLWNGEPTVTHYRKPQEEKEDMFIGLSKINKAWIIQALGLTVSGTCNNKDSLENILHAGLIKCRPGSLVELFNSFDVHHFTISKTLSSHKWDTMQPRKEKALREQRRRTGIVVPEPVVQPPVTETPMGVQPPVTEAPMGVQPPGKRKREMSVGGDSLMNKKIKSFELKLVSMEKEFLSMQKEFKELVASSRDNSTL